jgi:hypothetical protein
MLQRYKKYFIYTNMLENNDQSILDDYNKITNIKPVAVYEIDKKRNPGA